MNRIAITALALSPFPFLASLVGFGIAYETPMGSLIGDLFIFVPLGFLAFSKRTAIVPAARRFLLFALGSVILLAPAIALHFGPQMSSNSGSSNAIRLDPLDHPMPADGAAVLRGLKVKDGIMILKNAAGREKMDPSPFSACDYLEWFYPPSHFADENGHGIDFKLTGNNLLHFQDDDGSSANVQWTGSQFVLASAQSAAPSVPVGYPSASSVRAGKIGDLLIILVPMLALVLVTFFVWRQVQEFGPPPVSMIFSGILQVLGMLILSFALLNAPDHGDEVSAGLLALFLVCAGGSSVIGVAVLSWKLLRLRVDERTVMEEGLRGA
jgi:hypothetical protein